MNSILEQNGGGRKDKLSLLINWWFSCWDIHCKYHKFPFIFKNIFNSHESVRILSVFDQTKSVTKKPIFFI